MLIRDSRTGPWTRVIPAREITPREAFLGRRAFLRGLGGAGVATAALALGVAGCRQEVALAGVPADTITDREDVTRYNNFYEFGLGKEDPSRYAHQMRTSPWSVRIEGEVAKPAKVAIEDLLSRHTPEERVYRLRCVEAWSMVIPWLGIPLGEVLAPFEPTSRAKFVEFETLFDPEQMPGTRRAVLDWPYREGLRIDEAMHPLTLLAVGIYGEPLPNQNGAPLRLVVPWKYGFKSIKSIVRIRLREDQPATAWNRAQPREYGFYANVNPEVDHPRWSQRRERRIGEFRRRETLPFNGYAEQVASLYAGMDLAKHF